MDTGTTAKANGLAPFSLKDAPSFIERQFPVGRLSAEAYKERKAGAGQTLTALGSYWKGRKPLILVRAVVLGCLLPATDDPAADLEVFLKLMAMDDAAFGRRFNGSAAEFARLFPDYAELVTEENGRRQVWRNDLNENERQARVAEAFARLPYKDRLKHVRRPEECDDAELLDPIWPAVNHSLGTLARSLPELVHQLGIARFGSVPTIADAFCGGGSIPFEAARVGCRAYASDLNPIACMLTWGALKIVGGPAEERNSIEAAQSRVARNVDAEVTRLGIEHDSHGNRAKAYLYCLETRCPKTGWMVPMSPSWVISKKGRIVAKLAPDHAAKRYNIEIHSGVSDDEMTAAENGTVRDGRLTHPMNPEMSGIDIKTVRGDWRNKAGETGNALRPWGIHDFAPRPDDVFQERLYCIQWISRESLGKGREETFFAAPDAEDLKREAQCLAIVGANLRAWQKAGIVPDSAIAPGDKTDEPIRARGWTHWHHLFAPRQLIAHAIFLREARNEPALLLEFCQGLNLSSKICRINTTLSQGGLVKYAEVFDNQALNPQLNYAVRSSYLNMRSGRVDFPSNPLPQPAALACRDARDFTEPFNIGVTDPPYADAVNYHEITEFFIAWLRQNPPTPFDEWTWDSRRQMAIKGRDEQFRRDMVASYAAMTRHMSENGVHVVMFTHQDASVWADLGAILWAAGLTVSAAWNVITETESALKEGNYVQGTINLVLRKRTEGANARRMEIEAEIEQMVAANLDRLTALDNHWHTRANAETLYTDGDLTLAAYAAALQVVTAYSTIDRQPLDRDLYRKLARGERSMLRDLIDYAADVANRRLVPSGFDKAYWSDLSPSERFYVRMLDMEAKGTAKLADFQNFAKSFAYGEYTEVMASTVANAASLAGAAGLKGRLLEGSGFAGTMLRQVLFAVWKSFEGGELDPRKGLTILKTEYAATYWQKRQRLIAFAEFIAAKTKTTRPDESAAAHELAEALKLDRV